jgi:hypothetical protein
MELMRIPIIVVERDYEIERLAKDILIYTKSITTEIMLNELLFSRDKAFSCISFSCQYIRDKVVQRIRHKLSLTNPGYQITCDFKI